MLCDKCQKAPAVVHLTQVTDGQMKKIHLCEACAAKTGIDLQKTMSVTDVLMGLDHLLPESGAEKVEVDASCLKCGISRSEYKRCGRLGCAACYEAFCDDLIPMIRAVHHHLRHSGKKPVTHGAPSADTGFSGDLNAALAKAVEVEDYETAARLRDQMKDGNPMGQERHGT